MKSRYKQVHKIEVTMVSQKTAGLVVATTPVLGTYTVLCYKLELICEML